LKDEDRRQDFCDIWRVRILLLRKLNDAYMILEHPGLGGHVLRTFAELEAMLLSWI